MDRTAGDNWIFRLRDMSELAPEPVSRSEMLAAALSVSLAAQILFLVAMGLARTLAVVPAPTGASGPTLVVPIVLCLAGVLCGLLLPRRAFERSGIAALMQSARYRGSLARVDRFVLVAGVAVLAASLLRGDGLRIARLGVLAAFLPLTLVLLRLQAASFGRGAWRFTLPEWLRREGGGGDGEPDPGANCTFDFAATPEARSKRLGVRVSDDLLQELRQINGRSGGRLYHDEPLAVMLMDRDPADRPGARTVLDSLSRQLAVLAADAGLTRLQAASMMLRFVQECFAYVHDEESTVGFPPAGPYDEYGRFPVETIHDRHGDCECVAMLCAALLAPAGFEAALLIVRLRDGNTGDASFHAAVGLSYDASLFIDPSLAEAGTVIDPQRPDRKYLYGEATANAHGPPFGAIPECWREGMDVIKVVDVVR